MTCSAVVLNKSVRSSSSSTWAAASPSWLTGTVITSTRGNCVCDDVVLACNMADVCGDLQDKIQVVELAR